MSDVTIKAWLAAHPFWHAELLLVLGALSGLAKADWERFKRHQVDDPAIAFNWRVALRQYSKAFVLAGVPPIASKAWDIVSSVPPVVAFLWHTWVP